MKAKHQKFKRWTSTVTAVLLLVSTFLPSGLTIRAHADQADHIVISQIFGAGGGGTGSQSSPYAPYKNDFIELYNPTNQPVSLTGWAVQYGSSTGTSYTGTTTLSGSIPAHGYYLIAESSGGSSGVDLPAADATGAITMAASAGKVRLVSSTSPLVVVDTVGYGTGTTGFEGDPTQGGGPTATLTNLKSAQRRPYANVDPAPGKGNAWDTDNNAADFYVGAITSIRNTASNPETPMVPVISLQPIGINIQVTQQGTSVVVKGAVDAAAANSVINVYESSTKGTAVATGTAAEDGTFTINFTTAKTYTSLYIAAKQSDMDESAAIPVDIAKASTSIAQAKLSYAVINGQGNLIGNTGAAVANSTIRIYPNDTANPSEKLKELKSGTAGDFSTTIANAPDTVYVTQITSSAKGIMLESTPVAVTKADLSVVTKLADVRASDTNGKTINLNKYFTVEGVATVDNQILGTQKQNFYIQDETAGINIFNSSLVTPYNVQKGDKLKMTGRVLVYNGLAEFEPVTIEKISEGNPIPNPTQLTILDLNTYTTAEPLEGTLVTVTGKVSASAASGANYNVTFVDANNKSTTIRVMGATGIVPDNDLVTGKSYTVTGVLGQFSSNANPTNGYQVYPRDLTDIAPILGITHTAITSVYKDVNVEFAANADGAESVTTYYRATGSTEYTALPMAKGSEGRYTVTLEATNVPQDGFEYYIEAKAGIQVQSAGTKEAPLAVTLREDTDAPTISGEKPQNDTRVESPHPEITALINDPSGIEEGSVHMWLDGAELTVPAATITKTQVKYTPEEELSLGVHTVKVTAKDVKGNDAMKEWTFEVVPRFSGGNHYRGTTHNHTNISHDGAGTPEAALLAGQAHHYDWFAFSDHSHDIDPEKLGTDTVTRKTADGKDVPERSGGDQWQLTKDLATKYTKNGEYVVFPAFEMTSTTWGHSNIFGSENFIDRNINGKQYQDLNQYYAWVMTYDDIVGQFNHPDMSANAFNNFKPYNSDVDKLFTMLEVGNGSGHYGYANAETKFYSALDLGWHVAPTYGEDNHEGTWGEVNARTVIVADDLTEASLLHSMRNMRVYMEEDPNFTLDLLANGYYMGSTVDSKKLNFKISGSDFVAEAKNSTDYNYLPTTYKSDDRISKVELITNGGKVVDSITPMEKDFEWTPTYNVTGGQQWFVVKVTQMDGERIYSSPIWSKEESVDVKVNGIDIDGDVIVGGNPATLKATIANNGTEVVKNLKVDFYYDEVKPENFIGTNNISSILTKTSATATTTWSSPIKGDHQLIVVVTSNEGLDLGDVKYSLPVKIKEPLGVKVLIDANHGNENTSSDSGTYKNNLTAFTLMLQKEGYTVTENKVALTDEVLADVKVLVLTNARIALSAEENAAVAKFVKNGGSLLMAGKSNNSADPTINNGLLTEMGSAIRMNNDGVFDDSKTGNFWSDPLVSKYAVRVHPGLVTNHITDRVSFIDYYSGGSLSGVNNSKLTESGKVVILAKGNDTTYQGNIQGGVTYDAVSDTAGGSAIPLIASEEIGENGRIIVTGMNIFNNKQLDESYEPKGNDEFTFNAVNWLAHREMTVANIADVRKLADDTDVVVEGTVTTQAGNFFDAFYVQDATGGIMAFLEVPDGSLKLGDKVRVYGHIKTFENNKELEFTSFAKDVIKIGTSDPVQPKLVATGEATSSANQGLLVKVKGKVVSKYDENSYVINDDSGDVLVFTDGYIVNQSGSVPVLKKGDTLEAVGLSGAFAQGERIRVRNTTELKGTDTAAPDVTGVVNNGNYHQDVTITFDEGTATLNDKEFANGTVVTEEGNYTLVVTDAVGNKTTVVFTIDKTAPVVSGVEDGIYNQDVTIKFNDGTATLNGNEITSGTTVSVEGTYTFVVSDAAGNQVVVNFTIDKTAPAITGVSDNGIYNQDVKITFDNGTATLNNKEITSETVVTEEGNYTLVVTDQAGNQATISFTIDKTAPVVSGVDNNRLYNEDVTLTFNELGALLNGNPIGSGTVVSDDGVYTLVVSDAAGNVTTVVFTIDKTAPVVTGVTNNGLYDKDLTISFTEGTATLNDNDFTTGEVVSAEGSYTLVVTDEAGNKTTVSFTIDKTAPIVNGVNNNANYSKDVTISFTEGTATLDGKEVKTGTVVKTEGKHIVVLTDEAGNTTTVVFYIDKTAPVITGVANNGLYNKDVTISFNEGTAKLNGKTIANKTLVSAQGSYTLEVINAVGFKTIVKFTIDKTAPTVTKIYEVSDMATKVTGKTEAYATIKLYIAGNYQRSVTADKYGNFSFSISKQKAGTEIKVYAVDKAGNVSKAVSVKVVDKTAPSTPSVDKVTVKSTKVTGKAEAGSTVTVKVGSKVLGTATADKSGKFSVQISKQKAGKVLYVTAKDKAGNTSSTKKVTVKKK